MRRDAEKIRWSPVIPCSLLLYSPSYYCENMHLAWHRKDHLSKFHVNLWLLNIPASFKEKLLTFVILGYMPSVSSIGPMWPCPLVLNDLALWTSMTHKIFGVGNLLRMCKKCLLLFTLHSRYIDKIIHVEILHVQMLSQ